MLKQLYPDICLESKNNNSELVKAVKNLEDNHNKYIIIFDNSFDNAQVALELKLLKQCADKKIMFFLMDIICFEYILLEFEDLIKWLYAPDDELKSSIGDCWIKSCCEWNERDKDDICGLDNNRMSLYIKMKSVYEKTSLINQFRKAGLEHIV